MSPIRFEHEVVQKGVELVRVLEIGEVISRFDHDSATVRQLYDGITSPSNAGFQPPVMLSMGIPTRATIVAALPQH